MTEQPGVLHDYWRSSASYRVRIALGLKGIDYRAVPVDITRGEHKRPEHIARNPQGLVPVLDIDGQRLTQSLAMIEYLEETRPSPALLPSDPVGRARVRALAHAIAMEIHPVCNLSVANHAAALAGGDAEAAKTAWMQRFIVQGLDAVEALLDHPATGRFSHGAVPGLVECCLIPQLYNASRWGVDVTRWPRITKISNACDSLTAIRRAHPEYANTA